MDRGRGGAGRGGRGVAGTRHASPVAHGQAREWSACVRSQAQYGDVLRCKCYTVQMRCRAVQFSTALFGPYVPVGVGPALGRRELRGRGGGGGGGGGGGSGVGGRWQGVRVVACVPRGREMEMKQGGVTLGARGVGRIGWRVARVLGVWCGSGEGSMRRAHPVPAPPRGVHSHRLPPPFQTKHCTALHPMGAHARALGQPTPPKHTRKAPAVPATTVVRTLHSPASNTARKPQPRPQSTRAHRRRLPPLPPACPLPPIRGGQPAAALQAFACICMYINTYFYVHTWSLRLRLACPPPVAKPTDVMLGP